MEYMHVEELALSSTDAYMEIATPGPACAYEGTPKDHNKMSLMILSAGTTCHYQIKIGNTSRPQFPRGPRPLCND
ncbi:hypothetical protein V3C99_002882 [Haemonchus contortus]